jgi:site-specific DNA recombinase
MAYRDLGVIRLSSYHDESTSPLRQRNMITAKSASTGGEMVGWAEDIGVSALKVSPFKRKALAPWLSAPETFDRILVWRLDRIVRKASDLTELLDWIQKHDKTLISTTEHFDTSTPMGRAMIVLAGVFAELEASIAQERIKNAKAHLRRVGRWHGGSIPYGYMPAPDPESGGRLLVVDPESAPTVKEIFRRVIAGERPGTIAHDLNERGIPSSKTRADQLMGRKERDLKYWSASSVAHIVRSPSRLGYAVEEGEPVLTPEGAPVQRAEPLVTVTEWQAAISRLNVKEDRAPLRKDANPFLGVLKCARCGGNLTRQRGAKATHADYYRCIAAQTRRLGPGMCTFRATSNAAWVEAALSDAVLHHIGDLPVMIREFDPGNDASQELEETRVGLSVLARTVTTLKTEAALSFFAEQVAAMERRIAVLEAIPTRRAGWTYKETGTTYRDRWLADESGRRDLLESAGITASVEPEAVDLNIPEDLRARLNLP